MHYCSPVEPTVVYIPSQQTTDIIVPAIATCMPTSGGMPGAEGGQEKSSRASGSYETLQGNIYNTLDEAPPAVPGIRRPLPPEKPKLRGSFDDDGYLNVRDTKGQSELKMAA